MGKERFVPLPGPLFVVREKISATDSGKYLLLFIASNFRQRVAMTVLVPCGLYIIAIVFTLVEKHITTLATFSTLRLPQQESIVE